MRAVWQGICASPSTSAASYTKINNSLSSITATGANNFNQVTAICPISDDITITGLTIWAATAPAGAASWTLAIQTATNVTKNASGTFTTSAASIALTGTNTTASWSGSVSVSQSTFLNMILTPSGTPATTSNISWAITYTTSGNFYLVPSPNDNSIQNNASGNYYGPLFGAYALTPTYTAAPWVIPAPTSFTVTKIIAYSGQQNPMGTASKSYAVYNASTSTASSFSSTVTGGSTCLGPVGTGSMTFTAGQLLCHQVTYANSPGWAPDAVCLTIVPNGPGEVINGYMSNASPSASAVNYQSTNGGGAAAWNATESAVSIRFIEGTVKNLYAYVANAPTGTASYTFALNDNNVNSGISCTVTGAAISANDTTHVKSVARGETLDFQSTPAGSPAGLTGVALSFVQVVTQPADVLFDAIGVGSAMSSSAASPATTSWTHVSTGANRAVEVFAFVATSAGSTTGMTASASYGGVPMTLLGSVLLNASWGFFNFGLVGQALGSQTVSVTATQASANLTVDGQSVSVTGASGFGTFVGNSSSSSATWSVPSLVSTTSEVIPYAVGGWFATASTSNAIISSTLNVGSGNNLTTGYAFGASSLTLTGNLSATATYIAGGTPIHPFSTPGVFFAMFS